MELNGSKKIIILGLILLIVAGLVVVALKGFNVYLMLEQHESLNIFIGNETNIKEIKDICKEVFGKKAVVVRSVDFFRDSFNISSQSITDEERNNLVTKINEKYGTELEAENIERMKVSNVRIRDLIRPYIKPVIISVVVIVAYLIIRFRKMDTFELLGKLFAIIALTELALASLIAIVRIPVSPVIVNLMTVIAVVELVLYIAKKEKEYEELD